MRGTRWRRGKNKDLNRHTGYDLEYIAHVGMYFLRWAEKDRRQQGVNVCTLKTFYIGPEVLVMSNLHDIFDV
ncbi:hypothetical protein GCM10008014_09360 [Paenibacillus silvae]|uniref:Uncharacterized protein n=1 Tax=Paenibacillus silvae TaxID=1325358 RepID=A0ABQ1Z1F1_9BACL|nr:hypothetical protein GCM10008014_09360 [Paenibacillus silvae]